MHYNLLILAMSCNEPFFVESRQVTHDTWAKDVINGIYPSIGFYSYTSSENGEEYIENNTIYLNCSDEINETYYKTIRCFDFLRRNGITFDYVLRTNTSVYFNIPLTLCLLENKLSDNIDLYSQSRGNPVFEMNGERYGYTEFHGSFYVASSKLMYALVDNYDEYNEREPRLIDICNQHNFAIPGYDDITMCISLVLMGLDGRESFRMMFDNDNMYRYKCLMKSKVALKNEFNVNCFDDFAEESRYLMTMLNAENPEVINFVPFMQYRILTSLDNRKSTKYRYIELEHAYELYEACKYVHNHTPFI